MRSTSKSSTVPRVLTDVDGNAHDAIISMSIVTRETAYDLRATLTYPYESTVGAQDDAVVRRANVQINHSLSFVAGNFAANLQNFISAAKMLPLTAGYPIPVTGQDLWAGIEADFNSMFTDLVDLAQGNANIRDPETAYVVGTRPQLSGNTAQ
jgi:hypothetical protein